MLHLQKGNSALTEAPPPPPPPPPPGPGQLPACLGFSGHSHRRPWPNTTTRGPWPVPGRLSCLRSLRYLEAFDRSFFLALWHKDVFQADLCLRACVRERPRGLPPGDIRADRGASIASAGSTVLDQYFWSSSNEAMSLLNISLWLLCFPDIILFLKISVS